MDTERQVGQLEADVREIYHLVEKVDGSIIETRAMVRRQGNRLDALEANVAQITDDMAELKTNVAELKAGVVELKGSVGEILELLRARESGS